MVTEKQFRAVFCGLIFVLYIAITVSLWCKRRVLVIIFLAKWCLWGLSPWRLFRWLIISWSRYSRFPSEWPITLFTMAIKQEASFIPVSCYPQKHDWEGGLSISAEGNCSPPPPSVKVLFKGETRGVLTGWGKHMLNKCMSNKPNSIPVCHLWKHFFEKEVTWKGATTTFIW